MSKQKSSVAGIVKHQKQYQQNRNQLFVSTSAHRQQLMLSVRKNKSSIPQSFSVQRSGRFIKDLQLQIPSANSGAQNAGLSPIKSPKLRRKTSTIDVAGSKMAEPVYTTYKQKRKVFPIQYRTLDQFVTLKNNFKVIFKLQKIGPKNNKKEEEQNLLNFDDQMLCLSRDASLNSSATGSKNSSLLTIEVCSKISGKRYFAVFNDSQINLHTNGIHRNISTLFSYLKEKIQLKDKHKELRQNIQEIESPLKRKRKNTNINFIEMTQKKTKQNIELVIEILNQQVQEQNLKLEDEQHGLPIITVSNSGSITLYLKELDYGQESMKRRNLLTITPSYIAQIQEQELRQSQKLCIEDLNYSKQRLDRKKQLIEANETLIKRLKEIQLDAPLVQQMKKDLRQVKKRGEGLKKCIQQEKQILEDKRLEIKRFNEHIRQLNSQIQIIKSNKHQSKQQIKQEYNIFKQGVRLNGKTESQHDEMQNFNQIQECTVSEPGSQERDREGRFDLKLTAESRQTLKKTEELGKILKNQLEYGKCSGQVKEGTKYSAQISNQMENKTQKYIQANQENADYQDIINLLVGSQIQEQIIFDDNQEHVKFVTSQKYAKRYESQKQIFNSPKSQLSDFKSQIQITVNKGKQQANSVQNLQHKQFLKDFMKFEDSEYAISINQTQQQINQRQIMKKIEQSKVTKKILRSQSLQENSKFSDAGNRLQGHTKSYPFLNQANDFQNKIIEEKFIAFKYTVPQVIQEVEEQSIELYSPNRWHYQNIINEDKGLELPKIQQDNEQHQNYKSYRVSNLRRTTSIHDVYSSLVLQRKQDFRKKRQLQKVQQNQVSKKSREQNSVIDVYFQQSQSFLQGDQDLKGSILNRIQFKGGQKYTCHFEAYKINRDLIRQNYCIYSKTKGQRKQFEQISQLISCNNQQNSSNKKRLRVQKINQNISVQITNQYKVPRVNGDFSSAPVFVYKFHILKTSSKQILIGVISDNYRSAVSTFFNQQSLLYNLQDNTVACEDASQVEDLSQQQTQSQQQIFQKIFCGPQKRQKFTIVMEIQGINISWLIEVPFQFNPLKNPQKKVKTSQQSLQNNQNIENFQKILLKKARIPDSWRQKSLFVKIQLGEVGDIVQIQ